MVVVVLRRGRKHGLPRSNYGVSVLGEPVLSFDYSLVCAWEFEAQEVLERAEPGLLPLVPFARGATPRRIDEAQELLARSGPEVRGLETVLAVFSFSVFPRIPWLARIPEETLLEENAVYDEITARGVAKGMAEGQRKLLARQLRRRVGKSAAGIIDRLSGCSEEILEKIGVLMVGPKTEAALLVAIEKLLPKAKKKR